MFKISNVRVHDIDESVIASRNAMRLSEPEYTDEEFNESLTRAVKLVKESKEHKTVHCFDNFTTGILVSFDVTYPQYWTPEAQRYHWLQIVTSQSKMHRLAKMQLRNCCNKWVDPKLMEIAQGYIDNYNKVRDDREDMIQKFGQEWYFDILEDAQQKMFSNCPMGLELVERLTTNYKQLQTIYYQRRNHKLPEWREFCRWIETLPYAKQLILGEDE